MHFKFHTARGQESADAVAGEVEVPTRSFLKAGGITGLAAGAVNTFLTLLTFFWITKPDADQKRELEMFKYRVQVLQQAMAVEDPDGRRTSLELLRGFGLLTLDDGSPFAAVLAGRDTLPRWPVLPIPRPTAPAKTPATRGDTAAAGTGSGQ